MPTLDATCTLALQLMDRLGRDLLGEPLQSRGWSFGFDRAKRRLGVCRTGSKRITLSAHLAPRLPADEVEDTIRHEIAHAVDVERRGRTSHDRTWKAVARACGAKPERTYTGEFPDDSDAAPYRAVCPSCGAASGLHRQPVRPRRCRPCHAASRSAYLAVTHVDSGRTIWPGGATPGAFGGWTGVEATCPGCARTYRRAGLPKRATACAACCRQTAGGRFDERYRLYFHSPLPSPPHSQAVRDTDSGSSPQGPPARRGHPPTDA